MRKTSNPKPQSVKTEADFKKVLAGLLRKPHIRHEDLKVSEKPEPTKDKAAK